MRKMYSEKQLKEMSSGIVSEMRNNGQLSLPTSRISGECTLEEDGSELLFEIDTEKIGKFKILFVEVMDDGENDYFKGLCYLDQTDIFGSGGYNDNNSGSLLISGYIDYPEDDIYVSIINADGDSLTFEAGTYVLNVIPVI